MAQGHVRREVPRIAAVSGAAMPLVVVGSESTAAAESVDDGDRNSSRLDVLRLDPLPGGLPGS